MFNSDLTKHLAELSKISFTDNELEIMTSDMKNIIEIMDKVQEFDASDKVFTLEASDYNNLRDDKCADSFPTDKIIANAKSIKNNSFVVPKVV